MESEKILMEIERLAVNSAMKRVDLLSRGLKKAKRRKTCMVLTGLLALGSAGTITAVVTNIVGNSSVQIVAALASAVSGALSLLLAIYFSEDDVVAMLTGSSKYLSLRENVYDLLIHPYEKDNDSLSRLRELKEQYVSLDETYSKYFYVDPVSASYKIPSRSDQNIAEKVKIAGNNEIFRFKSILEKTSSENPWIK